MKKFLSLALIGILSGTAIFAQDTSSLNRQKNHLDTSSSSNRSTWDTTKANKTWDKNKAPKDKMRDKSTDTMNLKRRDSL